MRLHKFEADHLFTGNEFSAPGTVLVTDEKGMVIDLIPRQNAGEDIQTFKGILSPGFINCHCHLELSHMKGLVPEKTGLIDFVFKVVTQRHFAEEEILAAIEKQELEMWENGIVAVGDICNNTFTLAQKQKQRLRYYNFIEASGWLPEIADQRLSRSKGYLDSFLEVTSTSSIVPHAPYSVSDNLWQNITPYFENKVVSIHNQETAFEDELFLQGTGDFTRMYELMKIDNSLYKPSGKSSLQTYFHRLSKASSVLLVHNTFINDDDIAYAKHAANEAKQLLSFCICANANLYIEDVLPPIDLLRSAGCNLVLGTDSIASNRSLNIIDELKTITKNFPSIPTAELLNWSTLNGAKALEMDAQLGSFDKGKQPGVVLIDNIQNKSVTADTFVRRIF